MTQLGFKNVPSREGRCRFCGDYWLDDRGSVPDSFKVLLFGATSRPTLGLIQWVPAALYPGIKRSESEADLSLDIVPRLSLCGAIPPLSSMYSSRGAY